MEEGDEEDLRVVYGDHLEVERALTLVVVVLLCYYLVGLVEEREAVLVAGCQD
jgi:hypothetical protein